ncbi:hypothetical protein ACUODJ_59100, partial [Escherichia sp. HC-CC]
MTSLQLSIVHRLPQNYRWSAGFAGSKVEPIPQNGPCIITIRAKQFKRHQAVVTAR